MPITKNYGLEAIGLPRLHDRSVVNYGRANNIQVIEWLYPCLMEVPLTVDMFEPTMVYGVRGDDRLLEEAMEIGIPAFIMVIEEDRMIGA